MTELRTRYGLPIVASRIHVIRGRRVIMDYDLASIYGVSTKRLNEQVRRNIRRFPEDFAFPLAAKEVAFLNRTQIATGSQRHRDPRFSPYAFTEHGAIMAANVLRSERAIRMSVFVVRAFVRMRALLSANVGLARKLATLEKALTKRLDLHERAITEIVRQIALLLESPGEPEESRERIGFRARDIGARYRRTTKRAGVFVIKR